MAVRWTVLLSILLAACTDADGDGYPVGVDCDDADAAIYPTATETCDGVDNDCDGDTDEPGAVGESTWYADFDQDGFGTELNPLDACNQPNLYVVDATDCDDTYATVYPEAPELCDGLDNDCNGVVPSDELDEDVGGGDGYVACTVDAGGWHGSGTVTGGDDCNDADPTVYPGAPELCDGRDNDCSATCVPPADEVDDDGDGFVECTIDPGGWDGSVLVIGGGDCDDGDATVWPGAPEICGDGIDQACSGPGDDAVADGDGDGATRCDPGGGPVDCDDGDAALNLDDVDGDGASTCGGDCDDGDPSRGADDADGDGATTCDDCDDGDPFLNRQDFDGDGVDSCSGDCDDSDPGETACTGTLRGTHAHTVTLLPDGRVDPPWLWIHDGDTVTWELADRTDAVVPVSTPDPATRCTADAYLPWDPTDPNDFTGPMPEAASGVFTLGSDGPGLVVQDTACPGGFEVDGQWLCQSTDEYLTTPFSWTDPNLTGSFIRLRWNEVQPTNGPPEWDDLDREVEAAVRAGKLYSVAIKAGQLGTPDWIFDDGVSPVPLRYPGDGDACGELFALGSPGDTRYRTLYFSLLADLAEHLKEKNAWYRALAYAKPSGANVRSHENRLPRYCVCGCDVCNAESWAAAGYTPTQLYQFYDAQRDGMAAAFEDKSLSYALIQAGFPLATALDEFESCAGYSSNGCVDVDGCPPADCPASGCYDEAAVGGTAQTVEVLRRGREVFAEPERWVVQHNGLGPRPQDRTPNVGDPCPNEFLHPLPSPDGPDGFDYAGAGEGCPNKWALQEGGRGQVIGFQTNNLQGVADGEELSSAFRNAWDNSDGVFVEIYEQVSWVLEMEGGVLDPAWSCRTTGDWAESFHERRRDLWVPQGLPDPFPETHEHTFTGVQGGDLFFYTNPSDCDAAEGTGFGVIAVLDD